MISSRSFPKSISAKVCFAILALCALCARAMAQLTVTVAATRTVGKKAVITLGVTNSYPEKVQSARATIFLLDDAGKVVGQSTRWIIGGLPEKPGLDAKAGTLFHFVIETDKPYTTNRVFVNRIVLSSGTVISPTPPAAERAR